jgi:hypothetical protein
MLYVCSVSFLLVINILLLLNCFKIKNNLMFAIGFYLKLFAVMSAELRSWSPSRNVALAPTPKLRHLNTVT